MSSRVLSISYGHLAGTPVARVRIVVPPEFKGTREDMEQLRQDWTAMYNQHGSNVFALMVDITDASVTFMFYMKVLRTLIDTLRALKERSEWQVVLNGIVVSRVTKLLIPLVTSQYEPTKELVVASTQDELEILMEARLSAAWVDLQRAAIESAAVAAATNNGAQ